MVLRVVLRFGFGASVTGASSIVLGVRGTDSNVGAITRCVCVGAGGGGGGGGVGRGVTQGCGALRGAARRKDKTSIATNSMRIQTTAEEVVIDIFSP